MKLNTNKVLAAVLASSLSMSLFSCKDEEKILKDTENPVASLEISRDAAKLFNTVKFTVSAIDNNGIERVSFYLDQDSVTQSNSMPYEWTWNTKEVEDGQHLIRAIAYDVTGNKTEIVQEVTVKNRLLTVKLNKTFSTEENKQYWMFLSDEKGKTIGDAKRLEDTESLFWDRPEDFDGDSFYLTTFTQSSYSSIFEILSNYPSDEYIFKTNSVNTTPLAGSADLTINNNFDGSKGYKYTTTIPGQFNATATSFDNTVNYPIKLTSSPGFGFTVYEESNPEIENAREKYYLLSQFESGKSYELHTNDFQKMEEKSLSLPTGYTRANITVYGSVMNNGQEEKFQIGDGSTIIGENQNSSQNELKYLIAATDFHNLETYYNFTINSNSVSLFRSTMPENNISLPNFDLELLNTDIHNLKVSPKNHFDEAIINWIYRSSSSPYTRIQKRLRIGDNPDASYVIPEVPIEILKLNPQLGEVDDLPYSHTSITNHFDTDSYHDLLVSRYTNYTTTSKSNEKNWDQIYKYAERSNARLNNPDGKSREEIERGEMNTTGF